jgi:magnesium-transporting ATPase (P-type)
MEANIGIGIYGEEGMSAVQASDFALGEFKLLKRLLFIHGRINLYRISKMILYFFYKNFVFTLNQFYFAFFALASGQTFIDDWYITCYNLIFTAFPLCITAVTDSDIDFNDGKYVKKNLALLYKENRDTHKIFSFLGFLITTSKGIIISLLIFSNCCFNEILSIKGQYASIWYLSLKNYICVLIVVSMNLVIRSNFIVFFQPIAMGISTFLLFIIFLILNHYGFLFEFNSKASIFPSLSSPLMYFTIILVCCFSLVFDYTFKLINLIRNKNLSYWLFINRSLKGKISISLNINKAHSLKAARKELTKGNSKRFSLPYQEISRNYLLKKPPFLINKIDMRQITTPKNNIVFLPQSNSIFGKQSCLRGGKYMSTISKRIKE